MVCEKCKYEFFEGRNCPNCGTLAIFVNDDEYENRKTEWEEENKAEEEEEVVPKKFVINIDKEKVRKVALIFAAIIAVAGILTVVVKGILYYIDQKSYIILYDNGTMISSSNRSKAVFDSEKAIFSADGAYAYPGNTYDVSGEISSNVVSKNGKYCAVVSVIGNEMDEAEYFLYLYDKTSSELNQIYNGSETVRIVCVTGDGHIIYEIAELGTYNVVLSSSIYEFDGTKTKIIADEVSDFISCEKEGEFVYYDLQMNAYIYSNGKSELLAGDDITREGSQFAFTKEGKLYYLTHSGDLYDAQKAKLIDTGITYGSLANVAGADKLTYVKDGALYIAGKGLKEPVKLIEDYDYYGKKVKVLENSGKIYYTYLDTLYICNSKGKVKTTKNEIVGVYFSLK